MSQKYLGYLALAMATILLIILIFAAAKQDLVTVRLAHDELPVLAPMERVGSIKQGRNTYNLWVFDFEDRRCLFLHRVNNSGLTCWDPTLIYR